MKGIDNLMTKYICIWDFDSPLYAAATILDKLYIEATHNKSGRIKEFKNMTEFWGRGKKIGGWLADQKGSWIKEDFTITQCTRRNKIPIRKAKEILTKQIRVVEEKDFCEELKLVVGGVGNYRFDIYSEYKANRRKSPRPSTLKELKEWLNSEYNLIMEDGIEADDVMGIMGKFGYQKALKGNDYTLNDICLIYIDKDIDQKIGWKWNPKLKLKTPVWNDELSAAKSFWIQMLQGDTSDNIPGLPMVSEEVWKNYSLKGQKGIGKGNAQSLLANCKTPLQMEEKVLYFYQTYWDQGLMPGKEDWQIQFQLNYQLLKIMDKKGIIPKYNFK